MTVQRYKLKFNRSAQIDCVISKMRECVDKELQKSNFERRRMEKVVAELRLKNTY